MVTLEQLMVQAKANAEKNISRFGDSSWVAPDGRIFNVNIERHVSRAVSGYTYTWTFEVNSFGYNRQTFGKLLREAQQS